MATNEYKVYSAHDFGELFERAKQADDRMELENIWTEVNLHKYDGDLYLGDVGFSEFVFRYVELPIIKKLYPEELVHRLARVHIAKLIGRAKRMRAAHDFTELRASGVPYQEAKKKSDNGLYKRLADDLSVGYRPSYELSSHDADALFQIGIESFISNFYDRFYVPISSTRSPRRPDGDSE